MPHQVTKLPSYQEFPDNLDGWYVINFESNVFQTHFPKLVSYLSRMCPNQCHRVLDPEQIALMSIYQYLAKCRSETSYHLLDSIRVWRMLRRIAKRRLIDANNRMSRSRNPDRKTDCWWNEEDEVCEEVPGSGSAMAPQFCISACAPILTP